MWFTKNGKKLDKTFDGIRGRLFSVLGLEHTVEIETNFGPAGFKWPGKTEAEQQATAGADIAEKTGLLAPVESS
jgi:hypothetical protein